MQFTLGDFITIWLFAVMLGPSVTRVEGPIFNGTRSTSSIAAIMIAVAMFAFALWGFTELFDSMLVLSTVDPSLN